jgi:hypothetical protein
MTIKIGAKLTLGVAWMSVNAVIAIVGQECAQWFVAFRLLFHMTCLINKLISQKNNKDYIFITNYNHLKIYLAILLVLVNAQ